MQASKKITLVAHFPGSPEVLAPPGLEVRKEIAPLEPELEPPSALRLIEPGALVELEGDRSQPNRPLVLVSKGRKANLGDKQDLIESARRAGRSVEIHVFDDLP